MKKVCIRQGEDEHRQFGNSGDNHEPLSFIVVGILKKANKKIAKKRSKKDTKRGFVANWEQKSHSFETGQ